MAGVCTHTVGVSACPRARQCHMLPEHLRARASHQPLAGAEPSLADPEHPRGSSLLPVMSSAACGREVACPHELRESTEPSTCCYRVPGQRPSPVGTGKAAGEPWGLRARCAISWPQTAQVCNWWCGSVQWEPSPGAASPASQLLLVQAQSVRIDRERTVPVQWSSDCPRAQHQGSCTVTCGDDPTQTSCPVWP